MKNIYTYQAGDLTYEFRCLDEGIFRVRVGKSGAFSESLLSKYNILKEKPKDIPVSFDGEVLKSARFSLTLREKALSFAGEAYGGGCGSEDA